MSKVLVTGGGGFLGSYVCKELLSHGYQVRSFNRSGSEELERLGVDVKLGDIRNLQQLRAAVKGVDAVIHTAALAGPWGSLEKYRSINFVGTQNLIQAMELEKVSYLVHTSSPSVVYNGEDIEGKTEGELLYSNKDYCPYPITKIQAEIEVLEAARSGSIKAVALRPHIIWGPGDPHFLPKLKAKAKKGRLKKIGDKDHLVDVIYVENAAYAHRLALEAIQTNSKINGKAYFIGQQEPVRSWEFMTRLANVGEKQPIHIPYRKISLRTAVRAASLFEFIYKKLGITRSEPPLTKFVALQMGTSHYFSHKAAENDFGYQEQVSLDDGFKKLEAAVRGF